MRLEELIRDGERFLRRVHHSEFGDYITDSKDIQSGRLNH